ncbi:MAG: tetratricopeptide repeat protein [Saprospiraceae bacterium]|nr:tetratricopeptide repeat protein [Saprospiraceae bacterium]
MSKQRKPAPKPAPAKTAAPSAVSVPLFTEAPDFFRNTLLQSGLIFAFSFLLYANTLTHGFVLDDSIVINANMFTEKGLDGITGILSKDTFFGYFKVEGKETLVSGGRYRPLTLVMFAALYQFFGPNSFVFHLLTVLLFAATCVVLYRTLLLLFRPSPGDPPAFMPAWLAAVLFAAHPIHTEVVANIKGCDEIATLLGSLGALYFTLKAFDTQKAKWGIAAGVSFFLACLSKENAATFLLVIPLALWFFRDSGSRMGGDAGSRILKASLPVLVAFVVFFILRGAILHWRFGGAPMELMNNPFLKIEGNQWVKFAPIEKLSTVFYTLGKYVLLLFLPHPLTHDYYPNQIGLKTFGNPVVLLSFLAYGLMAWYALRGIQHRDPVRFGILFYLLTLSIVSNLVFPVGTAMGERFAFMPSVGFCIVAAALLLRISGGKNLQTILVVFGGIVLLFSLKTLTRNPAWASNEKLFFTDVETSVNSAKIHNACGGVLFDKAAKETSAEKQKEYAREGLKHLNKAVEIHPNYKDAYISRGGCNYLLGNFDDAIADYRQAVRLAEDDTKPKTGLAIALRDGGKFYGEKKGDLATAFKYLTESWKYNPTDAETARLFGVANGVQGKHADAINWFTKAVELSPGNARFLFDLGTAWYASGDPVKGEEYRRKALEINPDIVKELGANRGQ